MPMTFEEAYRQQVAAMPDGWTKRRHQHILNMPDNWRRRHALLQMEDAARNDLGVSSDHDIEIDWTPGAALTAGGLTAGGNAKTINWANILQLLAKLLPIILMFLGA
jgi:hypothetical protein